MSLCVTCGLSLAGDADFCAHHESGYAEDWAVANRIMCDFVHRKAIPPTPPPDPGDLALWAEEDPCGERLTEVSATGTAA